MSTPKGWYPDPKDPSKARWWDGSAWTGHTNDIPNLEKTIEDMFQDESSNTLLTGDSLAPNAGTVDDDSAMAYDGPTTGGGSSNSPTSAASGEENLGLAANQQSGAATGEQSALDGAKDKANQDINPVNKASDGKSKEGLADKAKSKAGGAGKEVGKEAGKGAAATAGKGSVPGADMEKLGTDLKDAAIHGDGSNQAVTGRAAALAQTGTEAAIKIGVAVATEGASESNPVTAKAVDITAKAAGAAANLGTHATSRVIKYVSLLVAAVMLTVLLPAGFQYITNRPGPPIEPPMPTNAQCAQMPQGWCQVLWAAQKATETTGQAVPWSLLAGIASATTDFGRGVSVDGIDRDPYRSVGGVVTAGVAVSATDKRVWFLGDSLGEMVKPYLKKSSTWTWTFDTVVGKSASWGVGEANANSATAPSSVVIDLGTNSSGSTSAFKDQATQILNALPGRNIYWLTHHFVGPPLKEGIPKATDLAKAENAALVSLQSQFPNLHLIPAGEQVWANPSWLDSDKDMHLHPYAGASQRAQLIESNLLPPTSTTGTTNGSGGNRATAVSSSVTTAATQSTNTSQLTLGPGRVLPVPPNTKMGAYYGQKGSSWGLGYHTGQDFEVAAGTDVFAVAGGTITQAEKTTGNYNGYGPWGNTIQLSIQSGTTTYTARYAHLSRIDVTVGQKVLPGQRLGASGFTGNVVPQGAAGAHLHFEIMKGGTTWPNDVIDPITFLQGTDTLNSPAGSTVGVVSGNAGEPANLANTIDSNNCPVAAPSPPIVSKNGEEGDFLLSPDVSQAMKDAGMDPQNVCQTAIVMAKALANNGSALGSSFAGKDQTIDAHSKFWTQALSNSKLLLDPATLMDKECLAVPSGLNIGGQIDWIFNCEYAKQPNIYTVTGLDNGKPEILTGASALAQLEFEAGTVSYNFSNWDESKCDTSSRVTGIFPLTDKEATLGGTSDRCNTQENIRAAARLILKGESVAPDKRKGAGPFDVMLGGWAAIPYALGDNSVLFAVAGPAQSWGANARCYPIVQQWITDMTDPSTPLATLNPNSAGIFDTATLKQAGDQTLAAHPSPEKSSECATSKEGMYTYVLGLLNNESNNPQDPTDISGGGTSGPVGSGSVNFQAYLTQEISSMTATAVPGKDSLVARLSTNSNTPKEAPASDQPQDSLQLTNILGNAVKWSAQIGGGPVNYIWKTPDISASCNVDSGSPVMGTANPTQDPTKDQVAASIYSQAMGLGLGKNAALIGIYVGLSEAGLTNNLTGDRWGDPARNGAHTPSRGVFQQMGGWVPAPYKAWSGVAPSTPKTAGWDFNGYNAANAWGPGGWAVNDPRMNIALSANLFFTGPAYDKKRGLEDMRSFQLIKNDPNLNPATAISIAQEVQGFSATGSYDTNLPLAQKYLARILSGQIKVPPFVNDPITAGTAKGATSTTVPPAAVAGGVMASNCNMGSASAVVNPGSTKLDHQDKIPAAQGWSVNVPGGHNMTYYSQYDPRWATTPGVFANGNIQLCGCGPTSAAMVIATLANKPSFTPLDSAALQRSLGGLNSCGTNSLTVFVAMAHREGLQGKVIGTDFTQAKDTLARGGLVMASVGPGNFTHGTHWIVIRGITSDGKLLVANPLMGGYVATTLDIAYDANTGEFPFNQGMVAIWP